MNMETIDDCWPHSHHSGWSDLMQSVYECLELSRDQLHQHIWDPLDELDSNNLFEP